MVWWQRMLSLTRLGHTALHAPHSLQPVQSGQQITELMNPAYFASAPIQEDYYGSPLNTGTQEDIWYRGISDQAFLKDVIPSVYLEIHNAVYEAYSSNPLAFAIIELTTSFVLGEGIIVSANNKRVQQVIDAFWYNPENHMEERVYSLCTELALYGELFIHYFTNKYDGSVVIRQIDPSLVDQIETDPEDIEKPLRYHRRPIAQTMGAGDPPTFDPTKPLDTQGQWFIAGKEVVHFAINKVSNAKRGKSDLATLLPWLRRYKDWLTDRVRINKYKAAFLWDVTLTNADKKTIDRKKMEYAYPPEPGSVIIHNEAEKWTAVEPKINADDVSEDGRQIKLMVAVGATLPEHYLSDGDNGNRATATEMSLPTLLKFKRRQRIVKYMLTCILDRVIKEATKAGKLGPRVDTSYEITFPEIDSGEQHTLAQATNYLVQALTSAKAQGWVSDETAMKLIFEFAGKEVDVAEERNRIANQPPDQGKPSVPDQRAQDRQDAEEKSADRTITGHSQPQIAYNRSFENKGSKYVNNVPPMDGRK